MPSADYYVGRSNAWQCYRSWLRCHSQICFSTRCPLSPFAELELAMMHSWTTGICSFEGSDFRESSLSYFKAPQRAWRTMRRWFDCLLRTLSPMWMGFWQNGHNSRSMCFPQKGHESKSKRFEPLLHRILWYSDLFIVYSWKVFVNAEQSWIMHAYPIRWPGLLWVETQEKKVSRHKRRLPMLL